MKSSWVGTAATLLIAGAVPLASIAAADEPIGKSPPAQNRGAEKSGGKQSGEGARETPRSDSPSQSQRVLPSRAGDRRGGKSVWIGAMCTPADATLRAQLDLPDGVGLVVSRVMPGSPAAKAGLKVHDIVKSIDGRPIRDVAGLVAAVEAAGDAGLKIDVIRAGKAQTLAVVPAARPDADVLLPPGLNLPPGIGIDPQLQDEHLKLLEEQLEKLKGQLPEADEQRLKEWLEQIRRGENQPLKLQLFGPGLVMQPGALPAGVNIVIERNGDEAARVTVTRGTDKWEVTENELDKLPPELRDTIRGMMEKK